VPEEPLAELVLEAVGRRAPLELTGRNCAPAFVLACDMRFAARETAIFAQPEPAFGLVPGGAGIQHLVRLMGRARALEVMLGAEDFNAKLAERYGWINRALPARELGDFVATLASRVAGFPSGSLAAVKQRVDAIALAPVEDFRCDSDLFGAAARDSKPKTASGPRSSATSRPGARNSTWPECSATWGDPSGERSKPREHR
jgi:enoyl-CoA hydratase/carnithine racemase